MIADTDTLVGRLIAGHEGGPLIDNVPDHLVPADLAQAYHLQDQVIARLGSIGGWKVMAGGQGEPLCSPIPKARYFASGATLSASHMRLVLTEIEVAVRLGRDLDARPDRTTVDASIAALLPAIEMVGSPFANRDDVAFNVKLADLQSNGAVIMGTDFDPQIRHELSHVPVTLTLDGREAKSATGGASHEAILDAVQWLAGHAAARGKPLRAGQVIITGSRILFAQGRSEKVVGRVGDWGQVEVVLTH